MSGYPTPQFDAITLTAGGTFTNFPASALPASGVTAGTYGTSTQSVTLTCDSAGIITGISASNIPGTGTNFTFVPQAAPTLAAGITWGDSTQNALQTYIDGASGWLPTILSVATAQTSVALTATAQTILPATFIGTRTLPANFLVTGKTVRIRVKGYVTTAPTTQATVSPALLIGGTSVSVNNAPSLIDTSSLDYSFWIEYELLCLTTGTTGTVSTCMLGGCGGPNSAIAQAASLWSDGNAGATMTVNTTVANTLDIHMASNNNCTIKVTNATFEVIA